MQTRRNPVATLADAEADALLGLLAEEFGANWLETHVEHPVGVLWQRSDSISGMELLNLAASIRGLLPIAPRWTRRQIELCKSTNPNVRKGAIFEIMGLAAFATAGHTVVPAREANPGYDGVIHAQRSGRVYYLSLKFHGPSSHEVSFRKFCQCLERDLISGARAANLKTLYARMTTTLRWGTTTYEKLMAYFRGAALIDALSSLKKLSSNKPAFTSLEIDDWSIEFFTFSEAGLFTDRISYMFSVDVPHHQNEYQNLEEKLNLACLNLNRHGKSEPEIVMLHLPTTANVKALTTWVRYYLAQPKNSLDVVVLFQPGVRRWADTGSACLGIYMDEIESPKCRITGDDRRTHFFVATLVEEPYDYVGFEKTDDRYSYQSGNIFLHPSKREAPRLVILNERRTVFAPETACTPTTGLHFHEVRVGRDGKQIVTSPKISPDDQLLIM